MTPISLRSAALLLAASAIVLGQQPSVDSSNAPASNAGWRRADDQTQSAPAAQADPAPAARDSYGQAQQPSVNAPPAAQAPRPAYGLPAHVTLKPGTFLSMRINQKLADNKNSVGDTFSGTLTQPLVVNGIVVAQRGQTVYGRVTEAQKVKNVHRLGVEVTGIMLVDGTQATVHTLLMSREGPILPYGHQQEGAITTATADGSTPPAGATAAVLATKGHDSVIYPGTLLTFQNENPVTIDTANNSAFRYVSPDDYNRPTMNTQVATRPAYVYGPGYYGYPYPYYGWGYPYWGPTVGFGFGGYWGGWHGGWRR
jgi:hypothetical protein